MGIHLIPYLPVPGGPFRVGTSLLNDGGSDTGELPSSGEACPVSFQFWYPAEPETGDGRARYRPAGAAILSVDRWLRISAAMNAKLSSYLPRYPVILSLPGWDGFRNENTTFVQDLASRGFIVVAIGYDGPACSGVEGSPSNAVATNMDFSSKAAFEHTLSVAHKKIDRVAEATSHVLDALQALDRADPAGRFGGRLDLNRLGVVGYSLGGAIAMQLCWRDKRLKAAVNIDGWLFGAARDGWIKQPLMIISDDSPAATSADLDSPDPTHRYPAILDDTTDRRIISEFAKHGGVTVTVLGSEHSSFSDMAYLSRRALLQGRRPDGAIIRTAANYAAAFFGQILNGEESPLFSDPPPGVRLQAWDRPAPESAK